MTGVVRRMRLHVLGGRSYHDLWFLEDLFSCS